MIKACFLGIDGDKWRGKGSCVDTIFSNTTRGSRGTVLMVKLIGLRGERGRNTVLARIRREAETIISNGHILKINNKTIEEQSS